MLKMNEIIILSYINKFKHIDLYEIQNTVNAPLVQLVNNIYSLYQRGYIDCSEAENDMFYVTEKAREENIDIWYNWTWRHKQRQEKEFNGGAKYSGILSKNGLPIFSDLGQINDTLQMQHVDVNAYHMFELVIKKKVRNILSPSLQLKERQRWILYNILEKVKLEDCVHGFRKEKSIKTNAECHVNKKEVLCLDIKDFFPSIDICKVVDIFKKMNYTDEVANRLGELCTFSGILPQGAPTSPYLANLVFCEADRKLMNFAVENNLTYTRYADDITVSSDYEVELFQKKIVEIIEQAGFSVNTDKTHIMRDKYRKMVTGLIVNDGVKIPASFKKKLRQEIYYCNKYGVSQHLTAIERGSAVNFREYLYGKAYYIKMVERELGEKFLQQLDSIFR